MHGVEVSGRGASEPCSGEVGTDNVGVEAVDFSGRVVEGVVARGGVVARHGRGLLRLRPSRSAPKLGKSSLTAKAVYKRRIKQGYARAHRAGALKRSVESAKHTRRVVFGVKRAVWRVMLVLVGRKKLIVILVVLGLLLILSVAGVSSCVSLFGGGANTVLLTSYTAEDVDILGADSDYEALGRALAARVARVESDYPSYDEYRYFLDEIGHDPYVLASYLTARHFAYTRGQVQAELAALFPLQYSLTLSPITEIRTRTETHFEVVSVIDPETGEESMVVYEYEVEVQYEYRILEVTLKNTSLGMVVTPRLEQGELEMFRVYMQTQGNRPELFEDHPHASRREFLRYEVPPEALDDERFAAMLREAEKFLGWPYVWGGSSPATSFDCSGYVSWVINNSDWSVGRLGARALFNICTAVSPAEARPGDLVFFNYTYAAPQPHLPTHVGIYVGNNMMIHCGNPISYASITTPYWTRHFYAFGRLP
jgi:hypothetical protein